MITNTMRTTDSTDSLNALNQAIYYYDEHITSFFYWAFISAVNIFLTNFETT